MKIIFECVKLNIKFHFELLKIYFRVILITSLSPKFLHLLYGPSLDPQSEAELGLTGPIQFGLRVGSDIMGPNGGVDGHFTVSGAF